jgi:glycosyltransferase involved in cell wall biosynthesis
MIHEATGARSTLPWYLVLPCYNEAPNLPKVVERTLACVRGRGLTPAQFQLTLVENGSRDDSLRVMEMLRARPGGEFVRIVPVAVNRGYGHGVIVGLRAAGPGILAYSHADQQCDPEDAFRGFERVAAAGAGERLLVKGRRRGRDPGGWIVSRCFEWTAAAVLGRRLHEINAQPKVFPAELVAAFDAPPDDFAIDLYVLLRALECGYRIEEIDVRYPPRLHGASNWSSTLGSRLATIARVMSFMVGHRTSATSGRDSRRTSANPT